MCIHIVAYMNGYCIYWSLWPHSVEKRPMKLRWNDTPNAIDYNMYTHSLLSVEKRPLRLRWNDTQMQSTCTLDGSSAEYISDVRDVTSTRRVRDIKMIHQVRDTYIRWLDSR